MYRINRTRGDRVIVTGQCIIEIRNVEPGRVELAFEAADDVRIAKAEELSQQLGRKATLADLHRLTPRSEPT